MYIPRDELVTKSISVVDLRRRALAYVIPLSIAWRIDVPE